MKKSINLLSQGSQSRHSAVFDLVYMGCWTLILQFQSEVESKNIAYMLSNLTHSSLDYFEFSCTVTTSSQEHPSITTRLSNSYKTPFETSLLYPTSLKHKNDTKDVCGNCPEHWYTHSMIVKVIISMFHYVRNITEEHIADYLVSVCMF